MEIGLHMAHGHVVVWPVVVEHSQGQGPVQILRQWGVGEIVWAVLLKPGNAVKGIVKVSIIFYI